MSLKSNDKTRITVVGSGYVGMSLAVLLAQHNEVTVLDIDKDRVAKINEGKSTISDSEIEAFLANKELSLKATNNSLEAYKKAQFVIVATPTDYDPNSNKFDTRSVDSVTKNALESNSNCLVVIKSTVPVGYTKSLQRELKTNRVIFSPEFLREGRALWDNLYPSRIIIGSKSDTANDFANLLVNSSKKKDVEVLLVGSSEAESIKLFANTYLAMRVSFFNELDSYTLQNKLDTKSIIDGICLDERIGAGYNNPSFGYGGYCLPKDTKQLLANFGETPQKLIEAIVQSNSLRKDFISEQILKLNPKTVGFFRLVMKKGSDNIRSSSILGIINRIKSKNIEILIFEPEIKDKKFNGSKVITKLETFKERCDVIVTNRISNDLKDVEKKCFSRDIYQEN
tara:strand:+ start:557 stop:1747 length:1191 start_codon:yes stop_codon:yes gene_type:complete